MEVEVGIGIWGGGGDGGVMHILACMAASPIWVGLGKPGNVCRNPGERQINEGSHSEKIQLLKKNQPLKLLIIYL